MTATVYLSDLMAAFAAVCVCIVGISVLAVCALVLHSVIEDRHERRNRPKGRMVEPTFWDSWR